MNNLCTLSNTDLHQKTLVAAGNEKSATLVLLDHLAEVDHRRLYAVMAFSSLWEYVHKGLGYSESQASERVSAMRLMVKIPEVKDELQAGRLSLTTTAKLATHARKEKSTPAQTLHLLKEVSGKSAREVERVLVAESTETARPDRVKPITSEITRIMIDVDSEFLKLMERVKELRGNPASTPQELLKIALADFVKRHEVKEDQSKNSDSLLLAKKVLLTPPSEKDSKSGAPFKTQDSKTQQQSRYIPVKVKNLVRLRSGGRCEYVDTETQRRCECRTRLQFEHHTPFVVGGENTEANLRHYCEAHNRLAAIQYFGREKMEGFLNH